MSCLCKYASCARTTSSCRFYCLWKNSLLLINTKLPEIALEIMFFPTQIGLGMMTNYVGEFLDFRISILSVQIKS